MKTVTSSACNIALGNFIKEKRRSKKLSQLEVASSLGLTQSYFSRIESGERSVDPAIMINLFHLLDVQPMEFFSQYF